MKRILLVTLLFFAAPAWADTLPMTSLGLFVHRESNEHDGSGGACGAGVCGGGFGGPIFPSFIDGGTPAFTQLSGGYDHGNARVNGIDYEVPPINSGGIHPPIVFIFLDWASPGINPDPAAVTGTLFHVVFPVHVTMQFRFPDEGASTDLVGDALADFTLRAQRFCDGDVCGRTGYSWTENNITLVESPEPATWLLMLTGLGGLGLHLWARKGRHAGQVVSRL